jgi:error-prone DNA polymerase
VVEVALIRPGPIVGQMVHPYLARRAGKEPVDPLHPLLEPVLRRTLGVPLFQEQLLKMAMIAASFSGGEAEELRRAMGFKRSEQRMKEIEVKLRAGMTKNGIGGAQQDLIVQSITSFALYGFPESHAASFALIAYASAYFKCHYLSAFTCALLNNQPMGFYSPAVIVKDAQRHGLRVLPVDVNVSDWNCTVTDPAHALRLGLRYVRGLRSVAGQAIAVRKPFRDVDDLARRVPELNKAELEMLAGVGALANLQTAHRRDALWKAARAGRPTGPLLEEVPEETPSAPLLKMTMHERLAADYKGTSLTIGRHPMYHMRAELHELGVTPAKDLCQVPNGGLVRVAGCVIVRQRPGTAKGIVFISMEDETGIANIVVMPDRFEEDRLTILTSSSLMIEGKVQNVDNVIHVLARHFERLESTIPMGASHDFR